MKKINIMILAGSLALSIGTTEAQQRDSTQSNQSQKKEQQHGTDQARQPRYDEQRANATYSAGDIEIISSNDIPESLRQSLRGDDRYQGWENAVIYHNKKTGEYLVSPRAHRFDSKGMPIDQEKTMNRRSKQTSEKQPASSDRSKKSKPSKSDQTASQDTASSQSIYATDQGRMQSTESGTTQDTASETSSQQQYANQDRDQDASADQPKQSDAYRTERPNAPVSGDTEVSTEGMIELQTSELPESLRETLNADEYKGWESGKLYRHASTGEYLLIVDGKNAVDGKQTYRFDKDGKVKPGKN